MSAAATDDGSVVGAPRDILAGASTRYDATLSVSLVIASTTCLARIEYHEALIVESPFYDSIRMRLLA